MTPTTAVDAFLVHPVVRDWMHRTWSRGDGLGWRMVEDVVNHDSGRVNMIDSDIGLFLEEIVDRGWLIPTEYSPSETQVYCGVGGRPGGRRPRNAKWRGSHTYAQEWAYRCNYESEGLMEYLGIGQQKEKSEAAE